MKKGAIVAVVVVAVIVVIIAVGGYYVFSNMNSLVAKAIEKQGSEATQTRVTVSGVELALRDARASVKGLRVSNPEGFHAPDAVSLDDITVGIDVKSVRDNPIVIDEIRVQAPVVYAELTKNGSSNIQELRTRIEASRAPSATTGEKAGQARRIRINRFIMEKGRIEVDPSALGLEKQSIELPETQLNDVGGAAGAPPAEVAKVVFTAITEKAASQIAGSEVNRLIEAKLGKGSLEEKAKGLLEKIAK